MHSLTGRRQGLSEPLMMSSGLGKDCSMIHNVTGLGQVVGQLFMMSSGRGK